MNWYLSSTKKDIIYLCYLSVQMTEFIFYVSNNKSSATWPNLGRNHENFGSFKNYFHLSMEEWMNCLTPCGLVTHYGDIDLNQHWLS